MELFLLWSLIYNKMIKYWFLSGCWLSSLDWCFKFFVGLMMFMYYEGYFLIFNEVLVIVFFIFGFYIVVGNVLVFIVYILDLGKKFCWVFNFYFVISLVVVDIFVGIIVEFMNVVSYWINNYGVFFSYFIFVVFLCVCFIVNIFVLMVDSFFVVCWLF